jgi:hypothetical protein
MITLRYEFDLLRVSHLTYDTIRYDIQKTHYAYPYNKYVRLGSWRRGKVVSASTCRPEDHKFESRQGTYKVYMSLHMYVYIAMLLYIT